MINNLKLHHIGVATRNIEKEFKTFEKLGYKKCSEVFEDPIQKMKGLFIECENQPRLELIEGIGEDNPVKSHILKGNKFYHFAYETNDIEECIKPFIDRQNGGGFLIVPITKATYFEKICFIAMKNSMIIELVQQRK